MIHFDEFENEQSISMISILVAFGSLLLGPLFAGIIVLLFISIATNPSNFMIFSVFGSAWASMVPFLIWYASKAVRRTNHPHLGTNAFLVFQLTTGAIIILIRYLPAIRNDSGLVISDNTVVINGLRYLFGVILLVANMTFIILSKVIRLNLSISTYLGLLFDLIVLFLPILK